MPGSKKIIVTGGAGFVGSHLVSGLIDAGYEVHVIDNLISGKREQVHPKAVFYQVDIRDMEAIKPIMKGAEAVFHLAALPSVQYSIENPIETTDVNLTGTVKVLVAARDAGVKRVIYSSSASVYGDQEVLPIHESLPKRPKSPYGLQKLESELACALFSDIYGLETVSLRYFNIFGPRQDPEGPYASVIPRFIKQKKNGKPLTVVGSGEQTRDFIHVRDIVSANISALKSSYVGKGEAINIGAGKACSVNDIAALIGGPVEFLPARKEIMHSISDAMKAKELLGWEPKISLEDGIRELLEE